MDQEPQSTEVRQRFPSLLSASRGQSIYSNESRHRAAPHFPCARSSALVSLANKNRTAENLEGEVIFSLAERRSLNLPSLLPSPMSPLHPQADHRVNLLSSHRRCRTVDGKRLHCRSLGTRCVALPEVLYSSPSAAISTTLSPSCAKGFARVTSQHSSTLSPLPESSQAHATPTLSPDQLTKKPEPPTPLAHLHLAYFLLFVPPPLASLSFFLSFRLQEFVLVL